MNNRRSTPDKKSFEVEIAGVPLTLRTTNDESRVNELVRHVSERIDTALDASQSRSLQNAAIVAALNIAEELLQKREEIRHEVGQMRIEAESLVSELESTQITQLDH